MRLGNFHYRSCRRGRQQGYLLLVLLLMAALIVIGLSAELPAIRAQIRHDREEEMIHRGAQYARAIKKFYKKTNNYPLNLDQLKDTNHIRFLRKKYKDPITGEDFRLLHMGEVQLTLKPSGTTTGPGVNPTVGQTSNPLSGNPGAPSGSGGSSSPFVSTSQMGGKGPTFGGGPIIGVASTSEKQSFHIFNDKDHYKDWQFIYDPTLDTQGTQGAAAGPVGGALITGPYNGTPAFGGGQVPGAVTPGQTGLPGQGSSGNPSGGMFGNPGGGSFGSNPNPTPQPTPR